LRKEAQAFKTVRQALKSAETSCNASQTVFEKVIDFTPCTAILVL
jgi:hypothetical protein